MWLSLGMVCVSRYWQTLHVRTCKPSWEQVAVRSVTHSPNECGWDSLKEQPGSVQVWEWYSGPSSCQEAG